MSLFNGVKDKLGFNSEPEWQDEPSYDEYLNQDYDNQGYDDGYYEEDDFTPSAERSVTSFDDYNPDNFSNITINSKKPLQVASYDRDDSSSYVSSRSSRSNVSSFRSSAASSSAASSAGWGAPSEPAFLDSTLAASRRSRETQSADVYTQFDSEVKQFSRDPSLRVEIVTPTGYGDIEKIGAAFKGGKTVAIVLSSVSPDIAKRILDFSFGVAFALDGNVEKEGQTTFILTRSSHLLTDSEREYLRKQGAIR